MHQISCLQSNCQKQLIKSDVLRNVKLVKLTVEFLKFFMRIAMVPVETASRKR